MVIERSVSGEVTRLVDQLRSHSRVGREAAVARLTVLGPRAVGRLLETLDEEARPEIRVAILRVLEAVGDRRAIEPAIRLLASGGSDPAVAIAAIGVARSHLAAARSTDADRVFEGLTVAALDRSRPERVRLAALDALDDLSVSTREALLHALADDPNPRVRRRAAPGGSSGPALSRTQLDELADGALPDAPDRLRDVIAAHGPVASLSTLHRLVRAIRAREAEETGPARGTWQLLRAHVHEILALRQSTVALYDLRESIADARDPLPLGFLTALSRIGSASCLEPVAAAYAHAMSTGDDRWRAELAGVFQDIVRRERLSRRHAAVRRVLARWPEAAPTLLPSRVRISRPSRSTPRRWKAGRT